MVRRVRLGTKLSGLTRDEIIATAGLADGGRFGRYLEELEQCGFIRSYSAIGTKTKGVTYQLIDNYMLFYLTFVDPLSAKDVIMVTNQPMLRNAWLNEVMGFVSGDMLFAE